MQVVALVATQQQVSDVGRREESDSAKFDLYTIVSAFTAKMAEVMHTLVTEAKKNRFSAIPKLTEEGKLSSKSAFDSYILL